MRIPSLITITRTESYLDGGTTVFCAVGDADDELEIRLNQSLLDCPHPVLFALAKKLSWGTWLPGRLLVNGKLVPLRSPRERSIVDLLDNAKLECDGFRSVVRFVVEFVNSDDYLAIANTGKVPADRSKLLRGR